MPPDPVEPSGLEVVARLVANRSEDRVAVDVTGDEARDRADSMLADGVLRES